MYTVEKQILTLNGYEWVYMNSFNTYSEAEEEADRLHRLYMACKFRVSQGNA